MVGFAQAAISVVKEREFGELKAAIEQVFAPDRVVSYLKALSGSGIPVRNLDAVLAAKVIDKVAGGGVKASSLYESLPVSDQAQIREFYLSKVEEVDRGLREKFHKVYQYS